MKRSSSVEVKLLKKLVLIIAIKTSLLLAIVLTLMPPSEFKNHRNSYGMTTYDYQSVN